MPCLPLALLAPSLVLSPAFAADKVGVAAAVKPEATSQPPGGDTSILRIGKSVVYNERIDTSGSGQVQVLLVDGSTFTVGPGSSLVIDKFVYNPASGKGALVASFSKGALRFVGGKLSKNDPGVKVKTPAGELTVRGGIFTAKISGPNKALHHLRLRRFRCRSCATASFRSRGLPATSSRSTARARAVIRSQTMADVNATQGAVAGKSWKKTASSTLKGQRYPYYYGIHPTGGYHDWPPIKELYYDGATTQHSAQRPDARADHRAHACRR